MDDLFTMENLEDFDFTAEEQERILTDPTFMAQELPLPPVREVIDLTVTGPIEMIDLTNESEVGDEAYLSDGLYEHIPLDNYDVPTSSDEMASQQASEIGDESEDDSHFARAHQCKAIHREYLQGLRLAAFERMHE